MCHPATYETRSIALQYAKSFTAVHGTHWPLLTLEQIASTVSGLHQLILITGIECSLRNNNCYYYFVRTVKLISTLENGNLLLVEMCANKYRYLRKQIKLDL